MDVSKQELIKATLDWCNERRKEKGLKPLKCLPKGERWDGYSCPCGKGCGYFVGRHCYYDPSKSDLPIGTLPVLVTRFTKEFDKGKFPEYDASHRE